MSENLIFSLQQSIKDAKSSLELQAAAERLKTNPDFLAVVQKGYFTDEAVRLVHLKADPNMQTPEKQASIDSQILGVGMFSQYLHLIGFKAELARKSIDADEATLEAIAAGEVE